MKITVELNEEQAEFIKNATAICGSPEASLLQCVSTTMEHVQVVEKKSCLTNFIFLLATECVPLKQLDDIVNEAMDPGLPIVANTLKALHAYAEETAAELRKR